MIEHSISKRYARALISVATGESLNTVDEYGRQLAAFSEACLVNANLLLALSNRHFDLQARERIVDGVTSKLELSRSVINFLKLLVRKGRIQFFANIFEEYQNFAHGLMNREVMTVVSATDLSQDQYDTLAGLFGKVTGKSMVLKRQKQPSVLGGVRVHIRDKIYDYTIKNQLEQMKQRLLNQ